MPKIENVTKIEVSNDITGSNFIKLYIFKENLIQLLLISENIWTNINNNKSQNNIYDLFEISFSETNLQLEVRSNVEFSNFNGISRNINKIFIQKSNYYENYENGFVSFNVIGYNLGGIWYSMSNYYKNENYNYLTIISGFKGNIITKPDVKKILFKVKFISQQENQNITIENLIYISNKRHYFGYTNDTKNEISCFPLIRPFSYITASVKLENENNSQIIELISDADIIVKSVMALLLLMSLVSWSIIFFKLIKFSILKILMWKFILLFESKNSLSDILTLAQGNNKNPLSRIIIASIKEWQLSKSKDTEHADNKLESITNRIKGAIEIVENNIVKNLESGTNILAIIGSNAPFIGLFGTVWGIMNSFQNIADSGNTSLAIVAPGIAEALFATAMGLFVAIPAVIFFNILNKRIDHFSIQIDNFSISILNKIIRKIE